ncbi:MAG TPA: hypothetical protein VGF30_02420 [Bacteroidia bacterium]
MKRFIDDNAIFEIKVPISWKYSLLDDRVHTFQEYDPWNSDCFQLSITKIKTEDRKKELVKMFSFLPPLEISDVDYRAYPDREEDSFLIKSWTTIFGNEVIHFTLIINKDADPELNPTPIEEKVKTVHKILASFDLIPEEHKDPKLNSYRFEMFLQGVGATNLMLSKAVENKAFIEATCLLATQIDSLLRIAIVLQNQLINKNMVIDKEWIYQGASDKKKSEKDIYIKAKELGILDEDSFNELYKLYEYRNRVVHRFIISEITLADVESISYNYYQVREKIKQVVDDIESEQIRQNIGMTTVDETDPGNKSPYMHFFMGKLGKFKYFDESTEPKE